MSPNFTWAGIIMILLALVADAIIGNVQEKKMKEYEASNAEVIFYSYGIGSIYLFVFTSASHALVPGIMAFAGVGLTSYAGAFVRRLLGIRIRLGGWFDTFSFHFSDLFYHWIPWNPGCFNTGQKIWSLFSCNCNLFKVTQTYFYLIL